MHFLFLLLFFLMSAFFTTSLHARQDTTFLALKPLVTDLEGAHSLLLHPGHGLLITESEARRIVFHSFGDAPHWKPCGGETEEELDACLEALEKVPGKPGELQAGFDGFFENSKVSDPVQRIALPDTEGQPEALALLWDSSYALLQKGSHQIYLFDKEMKHIHTLQFPSWIFENRDFDLIDLASNEFGELFVLDARNRSVYHFNANGRYLQHFEINEVKQPASLCHGEESLFITDRDSGKVFVFTESGRYLAHLGTFPSLVRARFFNRHIWVLSGDVLHLFNIYGEHVGNRGFSSSHVNMRDMAVHDDQLFMLSGDTLYVAFSQ